MVADADVMTLQIVAGLLLSSFFYAAVVETDLAVMDVETVLTGAVLSGSSLSFASVAEMDSAS